MGNDDPKEAFRSKVEGLGGMEETGPSVDVTDLAPGPVIPDRPRNRSIDGDRPRILIVDDRGDVIDGYLRFLRQSPELQDLADFSFFLFHDEDAGVKALQEWLDEQRWFTCMFIDGDLGGSQDGLQVIRNIRKKLPRFRYQAAAILTAHASWIRSVPGRSDGELLSEIPMLFKFSQNADDLLHYLVREGEKLQRAAALRMWRALQDKCAQAIAEGKNEKKLAHHVGDFLCEYYGVKAWYFRYMNEEGLQAIASEDAYGAGGTLQVEDVPDFMKAALDNDEPPFWRIRDRLDPKECGRFDKMHLDRALVLILGKDQTPYRTSFTVYRSPREAPFTEDDARELHHVMSPVHAISEQCRERRRQNRLAETMGRIMEAPDSRAAADALQEYAHEAFNQPRHLGSATKTTIRAFRRGSGDLICITSKPSLGKLPTAREWEKKPINYSEYLGKKKSVYVEVVRTGEPILLDNIKKGNRKFLKTVPEDEDVRSALTVPLRYGEAILGALNLEAACPGAYDKNDEALLAGLAAMTAASIYRRRSERFLHDLARLSARALNPSDIDEITPRTLLQEAAQALFRFTGFSELLLLEPSGDTAAKERERRHQDGPDRPWRLVAAWRGLKDDSHDEARPVDDQHLRQWNAWLSAQENWNRSFVRKVLRNRSRDRAVFFTNRENDILSDYQEGGLREGRPTHAQIVVRLGLPDTPEGILTLLFEHPSPLPKSHNEVLEHFARFMAAVYAADRRGQKLQEDLALAHAGAVLGQIAGQLRHKMAGGLATVRGYIDRLRHHLSDTELPAKAASLLDELEEEVRDLAGSVQETSHKLRIKTPRLRPLDPARLWNALIGGPALRERAGEAGVALEPAQEGMLRVRGDEALLKDILFNCVDNALRHGRDVRHLRLVLDAEKGAFAVADDGEAIAPERRAKLFEAGYTTTPEGGGQGLFFNRYWMRRMGGDIYYARENGENRFWMTWSENAGGGDNADQ